ncbi:hypothetical protein KAI54_03865 [Candidatus Gracilibacteria bacterium]|nr:hypothetical protein [Candidatus Gracilibacteria bacterium]
MSRHALYHIHRQNRIVKLRKPLFQDKWICLFNRAALVVGVLGPLFSIPQVYKIWVFQNAAGVSLISFSAYFIFDIVLIIYGIMHREKLITMMYVLWLIANGLVAIGAFLYG